VTQRQMRGTQRGGNALLMTLVTSPWAKTVVTIGGLFHRTSLKGRMPAAFASRERAPSSSAHVSLVLDRPPPLRTRKHFMQDVSAVNRPLPAAMKRRLVAGRYLLFISAATSRPFSISWANGFNPVSISPPEVQEYGPPASSTQLSVIPISRMWLRFLLSSIPRSPNCLLPS